MTIKQVIKTTCKSCHGGCGVLVTVENDAITYLEGNPESPTWGTMCAKGLASIQHINNPNRLKYPLKRIGKRGEGRWHRISWEEALNTVTGRMKEYISRYGGNSICISQGTGRGYNQYTARLGRSIGSGNSINPGYLCHRPRIEVAQLMATGRGRLFCDYHGWGGEYPKTQISWGKQLEVTNADGEMSVWFLKSLEKAKNLILIDPRATALANRATLWLQLRPGTDGALALGMLNTIINEELYDRDFVNNWTYGLDRLKERVQQYPPDKVAQITRVPESKIIEAARLFARDTPGCIQIGQCVEAANNSTQTLRAIITLAALTGNIERPGGMICWVPPATGDISEFGVEIELPDESKKTIIGSDKHKLTTNTSAHADTVIKQLKDGNCAVKMMHCQGGNPLLYLANTKDVFAALSNLEFLSVADLFMSPTAEYADIVLPVAHWLETDDIWDYHARFMVAAINKVVEPPGEAWPDNRIFNEFGKRVAPDYWFGSVEKMLDYQLRKAHITWKEFKTIGFLARMGQEQPYYKYKTNYWRKGGGFATPTGKVELYSTVLESMGYDPLPYYIEPNESPYSTPELAKEYPLILTTGGRQPNYFHSQYRQIPWLRAIQSYPLVRINPENARKHGIADGDWVWLETPRGRIKQKAKLFSGIALDVVQAEASWWYPEKPGPDHELFTTCANVLTSNELQFDPPTGAPSFRALLCKVYKAKEGEND